jgi:hypothetical protein
MPSHWGHFLYPLSEHQQKGVCGSFLALWLAYLGIVGYLAVWGMRAVFAPVVV